MTIEQLLSNGGSVANEISKKIKYKSRLESVKSSVESMFEDFKKDILYKLEAITNPQRRYYGTPLSVQKYLDDPDIVKFVINFIKKQAYSNIDKADEVLKMILDDDAEEEKEDKKDEEKVAQPEAIEIPIAMQVTQSPVNFGY